LIFASDMTNLFYLDPDPKGQPGVLLLHGLGADGNSWQMQFPALIEAGFRPVAPDTPGFGRSPSVGKWSIQKAAGQLSSLLDEIGATSVHVVGLSLGGTIALQFALDYPERVRKLVLANTFAHLRPEKWNQWIYFLQRLILVHTVGLEAQAKVVAQRIFPQPEQELTRIALVRTISNANPQAYRAAMRSLATFNVVSRLAEIRKPTLVMTGEKDTTVSYKNQRVLVDRIAGARQMMIPRAGHAASIDNYEMFNQGLIEFLLD
jgi:3-oxoadipate enol-lactonase